MKIGCVVLELWPHFVNMGSKLPKANLQCPRSLPANICIGSIVAFTFETLAVNRPSTVAYNSPCTGPITFMSMLAQFFIGPFTVMSLLTQNQLVIWPDVAHCWQKAGPILFAQAT